MVSSDPTFYQCIYNGSFQLSAAMRDRNQPLLASQVRGSDWITGVSLNTLLHISSPTFRNSQDNVPISFQHFSEYRLVGFEVLTAVASGI
jgi:hypothetical protein